MLPLMSRTRARRNDVRTLVSVLGGDSFVPALYDVRYGITATSVVSNWADARGSGYGPALTASGSKRPSWDGTALTITFDGVDDCLACALNSLFDMTGAYSIVIVAASTGANNCVFGIANNTAGDRDLSVRATGGTNHYAQQHSVAGAVDVFPTAVAPSSTVRLFVASKNATTGVSFDIPNKTRASDVAPGNGDAGNNAFSVGNIFTGGPAAQALVARAAIAISKQVTTTEVTNILTWAKSYHGAVAA